MKESMLRIADLHCDLLCYLAGDSSRTAYDAQTRCSIPQLQSGGVGLQTMAVFTRTLPQSSQSGARQIAAYRQLTNENPGIWKPITVHADKAVLRDQSVILTLLAIENASGLCGEEEPLKHCFDRLNELILEGNAPLYIGLTWNEANRFGGGSSEQAVGLKPDGKTLLESMHQTGIALDFSHASDRLITESLEYIDAQGLDIPVMASHSNFRSVQPAVRNLPDELALEIGRREGVIGINFYMGFVGEEREGSRAFLKHLEKAIKLGISSKLCFGADFFYEGDLPPSHGPRNPLGFAGYTDASCYPKLLQEWRDSGLFSEQSLAGICWGNFERFLRQASSVNVPLTPA